MSIVMKKLLLILLAFIITTTVFAQKERKFVREGNAFYDEGLKDTAKLDTVTFGKAEVAYRRALQIKPDDFHWQFNLANSIYKQNKPDQAASEFEKLAEIATDPAEKSMVYHNLGNSLLAQKKFDQSIDAYKKDQNKDQNKDKKDQNKDQQQQQQPQPNKISKQSAEQMLQALENDEKQTQEKVKKAQALKSERTKVEKNW